MIGPDGMILTRADLPKPGYKRWHAVHKARVVFAVNGGLITLQEARELYYLSVEEFLEWRRAYTAGGKDALRAMRPKLNRTNGVTDGPN